MTISLREVWQRRLAATDYEQHMAAIGQAQANAGHVAEFASKCPAGARLLVAGAGTGQMFDYMAAGALDHVSVVYSDLCEAFLKRLRERRPAAVCVCDDLERTALAGPFDAACVVLVLEHIDWQLGLRTLAGLGAERVMVVVQVNPPEMTTAVTPARELPGTMRDFAGVHPHLTDPEAVIGEMSECGYRLVERRAKCVSDNKLMLALEFRSLGSFQVRCGAKIKPN
jgi:SAM-dependent methyltransferase